MRRLAYLTLIVLLAALPQTVWAQQGPKWVVSWAASAHGPYPVGNPRRSRTSDSPSRHRRPERERPDLSPDRAAGHLGDPGAAALHQRVRHQARHFRRRICRPADGRRRAGQGTNRPVTFGGKDSVTVAPGTSVWSDAVELTFARDPAAAAALAGRKLAVSFHVAGESGPMTWHAKALTTSYVTAPGAGSQGKSEDEAAFPYSTASWFFLDAADMMAPAESFAIVAFGDSITDGTASTMNGDDRWPDVLSRRLHAIHGNGIAVVNAGIGGNQIVGPAEYGPHKPFPGGPSARQRIERDVLDLSGVGAVIWLEGINDFSKNGNAALETVQEEHEGGRCSNSRAAAGPAHHRRHGGQRARRHERRARFPGAGREAQSAQRVHSQLGPVRRRDRLRQGDARSGDGRAEGPSSCPTARPAEPATSFIPTAPAIWRWEWPSTSICWRRNSSPAGDSPLLRPRSLSPATQRVLGKHSQLALAHVAHQKLHL